MTMAPQPTRLDELPPFWGGDLQTIRMNFRRDHPSLDDVPPFEVQIPFDDGTGDQTIGWIHAPKTQKYPGLLVVLGHGYGGDADSAYMVWATRFFIDAGISVLRVNMRGAGKSRALCRNDYHGAKGEDLVAICDWLAHAPAGQVPFKIEKLYFVGTSLSGAILANALARVGDADVRGGAQVDQFIGGTGLCFAMDMPLAARRVHVPRNWPYLQYLLGKSKEIYRGSPAISAKTLERVEAAKTIYEIDEAVTIGPLGFSTVFEFYEFASAKHSVPHVRRPMKAIATMNDPWVPAQSFLDVDWSNPLAQPRLFTSGGHCGLWERGQRYQRHFHEALAHLESLL